MDKEQQKRLITEIMNEDARDGLYEPAKTAVEWLEEELKKHKLLITPFTKGVNSLFEQAKAMEKKQIENAHLSGLLRPLEMEATKQAEQYYNNTYLTTRLSDSSNNIQIIK
jgi:hypothetical protein